MADQPTPDSDAAIAPRPTEGFAAFVSRHQRGYQIAIWSVVVIAVLGGTVAWLVGWLEVQEAGYWGGFVVNLVSSAAVVVPAPGLFAVCAAAAPELGLNYGVLAVLGAAGSTIGELTGYLAGYGARGATQNSRYYRRIHRVVERRGGLALFVLAVVPNPLFDIGGIAAGSLGYPIIRFILWVGLGKLLKFAVFAYACRQSITWIVDLV
ncbi:MAG: VTT domain-containing protein [Chloroflexi bacterium]|nr:VTT domain-containing protein [Chloroflexota bacterium]